MGHDQGSTLTWATVGLGATPEYSAWLMSLSTSMECRILMAGLLPRPCGEWHRHRHSKRGGMPKEVAADRGQLKES